MFELFTLKFFNKVSKSLSIFDLIGISSLLRNLIEDKFLFDVLLIF